MKLSDLGEFGLIARLARHVDASQERVIAGIGDDCAVVESGVPGRVQLFTTDFLTEDVHFRRRDTSPRLLGRKALAVNLSDIAAMGGTPSFFVVGFSAPSGLPVDWADAFYGGLLERARASGTALVGGDTSATLGPVSISVAVLGECPTEQVVYRRGARPGDGIFVTGWPGESAAGLACLGAGIGAVSAGERGRTPGPAGDEAIERVSTRHQDPEPRLAAGRHLAAGGIATAMIDVSDGLVADLGHILERSGVGARIEAPAIPLSEALKEVAGRLAADPLALALGGGEDYELLFTARDSLDAAALSRALDLEVTRIGQVTAPGEGLRVLDARGEPVRLPSGGYAHFRP